MRLLFILLLSALIFSACPKVDDEMPPDSELAISFFAKHKGAPVVFFENVDYPGLNYMRYVNFRFYISDIQLLSDQGNNLISNVAMVDFKNSHNDLAGAQNGETLVFTGIEPGSFHTLRFGVGLTPELNAESPAFYDLEHPLGFMGNYWPWRQTYIFSIIEAQAARIGSANVDLYPTFHSGSDQMFYYAEIPVEINIEFGHAASVSLTIDMMDVFLQNNEPLNIEEHNFTHTGPDDAWLAALISNNLANAIKLRVD